LAPNEPLTYAHILIGKVASGWIAIDASEDDLLIV